MTLVDQLHIELIHAADFRMYDTKGAMLPGVANRIGVPMSAVRKAAKRIIRQRLSLQFLEEALASRARLPHEVVKTMGLVIAEDPALSFPDRLDLARRFQPFITNWAVCDLFAGAMKSMKAHPGEAFRYIENLTASENIWEIRTGLVFLLSHFLDPETLPRAIGLALRPNVLLRARDAYYVSMGLAWALSIFYVADPQLTASKFLDAVRVGSLDEATARKTAQKIRESLRISRAAAREFRENMESALSLSLRR